MTIHFQVKFHYPLKLIQANWKRLIHFLFCFFFQLPHLYYIILGTAHGLSCFKTNDVDMNVGNGTPVKPHIVFSALISSMKVLDLGELIELMFVFAVDLLFLLL